MIPNLRPLGFVRSSEVVVAPKYLADVILCIRNGWPAEVIDGTWVRDLKATIEIAVPCLEFQTRFGKGKVDVPAFETLIRIDTLLDDVRKRLGGIGSLAEGKHHFVLITLNKGGSK